MAKERPDELSGKTIKIRTECGSLFLTLNQHEGELYEIDITLGKSGNCVRGLFNLISRLISLKLQSEMSPKDMRKFVNKHFTGVTCGSPIVRKGNSYTSCIDFVGKKIVEELGKEGK